MAGILTISLTKKDYRGRGISRGRSVPVMMRNAMEKNLGQIERKVRQQLPGSRLKASTHIIYSQTPQGATANLRVGDDVPFAFIHAKWGSSPTVIRPKAMKHLAIPLTAQARSLQQSNEGDETHGGLGLFAYHPQLHRGWGKGAHTLFWGGSKGYGGTPMFHLAHKAVVKPSVNLQEVSENMRLVTAIAIREAFKGYDFGYVSVRKG